MDLREEIIQKEKALLTVKVRRSAKTLKELLSQDFKEVGASGAYFGFRGVLERLPEEESWSAKTQDWEFRILAPEVAQVVYRVFIVSDKNAHGTYSRRSSIWRLESGGWKMIFHQGTKVEPFELQLSG